jgi:hypothetical protein
MAQDTFLVRPVSDRDPQNTGAQNRGPQNQNRAKAATALERQDQVLAGLLIGSPEFQRR